MDISMSWQASREHGGLTMVQLMQRKRFLLELLHTVYLITFPGEPAEWELGDKDKKLNKQTGRVNGKRGAALFRCMNRSGYQPETQPLFVQLDACPASGEALHRSNSEKLRLPWLPNPSKPQAPPFGGKPASPDGTCSPAL
jgi:hypothetical protein